MTPKKAFKRMISSLSWFGLSVLCSCSIQPLPVHSPQISLPRSFPNKDQIALVNGAPISLGSFEEIRRLLPKNDPNEAYWISTASLALFQKARTAGSSLSLKDSLVLARYSRGTIGFPQAKGALESYMKRTVLNPPSISSLSAEIQAIRAKANIVKNLQALAELGVNRQN